MTATVKILTSVHGRRLGLSASGKLVVNGKTALAADDGGVVVKTQGTPGTLNATGTLTAALLSTGIVTSTTAAAVAATLDTGTAMDTALAADVAIGDCFDWAAIATGANAFTVTASTGHTIVGSGVVATGTTKQFRSKRAAAATWVTYNLG